MGYPIREWEGVYVKARVPTRRLRYPRGLGPAARWTGHSYEVCELGRASVRLRDAPLGSTTGTLLLSVGRVWLLRRARVVGVVRGESVLSLAQPLSTAMLRLIEQAYRSRVHNFSR